MSDHTIGPITFLSNHGVATVPPDAAPDPIDILPAMAMFRPDDAEKSRLAKEWHPRCKTCDHYSDQRHLRDKVCNKRLRVVAAGFYCAEHSDFNSADEHDSDELRGSVDINL